MKMGGIYKIENLITNKVYIGKSRSIETRFQQHKSALNSNRHVNENLQVDWNLYGESNFEFFALKYVNSDYDLFYYESYYANKYKEKGTYNIRKLYDHDIIKNVNGCINEYIYKIKRILPKGDKCCYVEIPLQEKFSNYLKLDNDHIKTLFALINTCYFNDFKGYTFQISYQDILEINYVPSQLVNEVSANYFIG